MSRPAPGHIILLYCDWLSKSKYFLVAGVDDEQLEGCPMLLYISTNKLKLAKTNPAVDADFLKIKQSEYPFLEYDSWLDCGDVCRKLDWRTIEYQIRQCVGRICARILISTRDDVVNCVGKSERLSTRQQMLICEALGALK